jgi:hypothetical protein
MQPKYDAQALVVSKLIKLNLITLEVNLISKLIKSLTLNLKHYVA